MLLVDTNVWLAAADRSSTRHGACAQLIAEASEALASTVPVISETAWLLLDRGGPDAQRRFLAAVAQGQIIVLDLLSDDWTRIHELVTVYADASLDVIDASTIAVAERLGHTVIATLDERDFRIVRPVHTDAFELVPGPD